MTADINRMPQPSPDEIPDEATSEQLADVIPFPIPEAETTTDVPPAGIVRTELTPLEVEQHAAIVARKRFDRLEAEKQAFHGNIITRGILATPPPQTHLSPRPHREHPHD